MLEQHTRHEKDAPLRRDIRTLGDALGKAIKRPDATTVFDTVELLRGKCKRLRDCAEDLRMASSIEAERLLEEIAKLDREITHIVDNCSLDTAIDVVRA